MPRIHVALLSLATLCGTAFSQSPRTTGPGIVNFVQGQVSVEGRPVRSYTAGSSLQPGQYLATGIGKAEIVLAPGIVLRLGDDSTLQMVASDATHTEVRLEKGRADVQALGLPDENKILIDMRNGQTHLLEPGLYSFNDTASTVRVFDGKAESYPGADLTTDVKSIEIKEGHELTLSAAPAKPQPFDKDKSQDALYQWGDGRAAYLSQQGTQQYAGDSGYFPSYYGGPYYAYAWPGYGYYPYYGYGYPYYAGGFFYGGGWGYGGWGYRGGGWGGWGYHGGGGWGGGGFHGGGGGGPHPGGGGGHR